MKKQLLILALAGVAFTACKKDDDAPQNLQVVKKITEIKDGDTTITNVSYDNSKRITLLKSSDGKEIKLTYNNNNLSMVENKISATEKTKLEVIYTSAKPTIGTYTIYNNNAVVQKYKYNYSVNAANQVTEIVRKDSTNNTTIGKTVFTYTNSNITKVQSYLGTTLTSTQEFTYGSKKSMYYNSRVNYVIDSLFSKSFSANDVIKEKNTIGTLTHEITNTYTYNNSGFPLSANVLEKQLPNGTPKTSKLKFDY